MSGLTPFLHAFGIPSLGTTLGPIYLGVTMGMMLYGLTIHQAYRYYKHYPEDGFFYPKGIYRCGPTSSIPTNLSLATLRRAFETLHTAVWMYLGYRYLVAEAFDIGGILSSHWTVSSVPPVYLPTTTRSHITKAMYLVHMPGSVVGSTFYRWFLIPAVVTMCTGVMFAIVAGVKAFLVVKQITDLSKLNWMVSIAYGFSGGSDILLASILIFTLLRIRRESKVRGTRSVLNTLIIYTINTGLLTSIVSFFAFLFVRFPMAVLGSTFTHILSKATTLPGNFIYAGISIVGSRRFKHYKLGKLTSVRRLNSRRYLNNRLQDDFSSVNLGGSDAVAQTSSIPRLSAPTRRARDETSTMVWAVRQGSTTMSTVNGQFLAAKACGRLLVVKHLRQWKYCGYEMSNMVTARRCLGYSWPSQSSQDLCRPGELYYAKRDLQHCYHGTLPHRENGRRSNRQPFVEHEHLTQPNPPSFEPRNPVSPSFAAIMDVPVTTKLSFGAICKTIGAVVLGGIIGIMYGFTPSVHRHVHDSASSRLYGLTIHQVYRYFKMYPKDGPRFKVFVLIMLTLETLHMLLWGAAGFHYLIEEPYTAQGSNPISINDGDLSHDLWILRSVRLSVMATSLTIGATQCFYAWRVYHIGPHYKWLVTPAVVFLVVDKGFALGIVALAKPLIDYVRADSPSPSIAASIQAFRVTSTVADFQRLNWLVAASYGLASVTDLTLAGTLVYVLHKSRTGSKSTLSIQTAKLTRHPFDIGVLTSLFAFIFAIILPGNLIYAGISIVGTKLYANSVLAVLNSRREINDRFEDDFASVSPPILPRDPRTSGMRQTGTELSMVWAPAQRSLSSFDTERSLAHCDGMTFARGTGGEDSNHSMAV
ncbi:hypothetical protein GY45DRAFT_1381121 [Cubamyces sp. BRFM 1775]|nr:hypothetical protein GY45DRAFT_1381121 [Cubamyces sp. BRFM 1775]